ncbi:MAG: thiol:disulfide interchange protein [Lutibacter sp.]|nr:MAG: thiol:disulfide interchange protein [Lutibacter sp.]
MKKIYYCCFLVLLLGCQRTLKKESNKKEEIIKKEISFINLNGVEVQLSDFKGKKLLVNYWATWCGPCKKEMPALLHAQELLKDSNYVFLLISDESVDKISEFKAKTNYDFNFLKLKGSIEMLGIYSLPTTYIYNDKGKKVKEIVGAVIWDSKETINTLKNI